MKRKIFIALLLIGSVGVSWSPAEAQTIQDTGTVALNTFIQKITRAYNNPAWLQFRLKYRYANERRPDLFLDSLSGEVEMDKGRSRTVLDGMETILTGRYAIQVMPEYKSIYLSAAKTSSGRNPLPMLDSLMAHLQGIKAIVEHAGALEKLSLLFPQGQPYAKLEMTIDANSGLFRQVDYWLNTSGLVGKNLVERPGHPAPYQARGRVEILFTDYRHGKFDDGIFLEDNFFSRTAGRYEPAGRYKDYHIYLASSNL
jgi:hypothetical protein